MSPIWNPGIGELVTFDLNGEPASGEVLEVIQINTVGVRVTELGDWYGRIVHYNVAALSPVVMLPAKKER